jgi:hypothetical protein
VSKASVADATLDLVDRQRSRKRPSSSRGTRRGFRSQNSPKKRSASTGETQRSIALLLRVAAVGIAVRPSESSPASDPSLSPPESVPSLSPPCAAFASSDDSSQVVSPRISSS